MEMTRDEVEYHAHTPTGHHAPERDMSTLTAQPASTSDDSDVVKVEPVTPPGCCAASGSRCARCARPR